jgi:hypothetical protein
MNALFSCSAARVFRLLEVIFLTLPRLLFIISLPPQKYFKRFCRLRKDSKRYANHVHYVAARQDCALIIKSVKFQIYGSIQENPWQNNGGKYLQLCRTGIL